MFKDKWKFINLLTCSDKFMRTSTKLFFPMPGLPSNKTAMHKWEKKNKTIFQDIPRCVLSLAGQS